MADESRPMIMPNRHNADNGEPGFGIYVHWPFCAAKCPYCDFNSHVRHKPIDQAAFAQAYKRELAHMAQLHGDAEVTSVFFGGGTPSLMEPETVLTIVEAIKSTWTCQPDMEVTLEANPTSVEASRFRAYNDGGINRVSLGVQSLRDDQLKFLGRMHSAREAMDAITIAAQIFSRFSFDLIYARPDQTAMEWSEELNQALALGSDHLSLYQLTIEQETPFFDLQRRGKLTIPDSEHAAQLYELTQELTEHAGLPAYEVSNHARPGHESRHNLTYWRGGDWVGVGPGAHGRLSVAPGRLATSTIRYPEHWLDSVQEKGHGMEDQERLSTEDIADEFLLMGLRLREGIDIERFSRLGGRPLQASRIQHLIEHGLIEQMADDKIRATLSGWLVLDAVIADLAA